MTNEPRTGTYPDRNLPPAGNLPDQNLRDPPGTYGPTNLGQESRTEIYTDGNLRTNEPRMGIYADGNLRIGWESTTDPRTSDGNLRMGI